MSRSEEELWISEARICAEVTRAKRGGPIHVIGGPREARVTIHSQQCRAINLVCALRERHLDLTKRRVAIVGAGAAGMTAASALRAIGLPEGQLTIYELAASPLYTQRASYSRFLHPRLFHWPEAGWRHDEADLPVGDWEAGYAATVRDLILSSCAGLPIEFCTEVHDVRPVEEVARVRFRRLHQADVIERDFDIVLVASGFPPEPRVEHTIGGNYWHAVEGLDDLQREVHVVGDGDGALTEVLMMLIDRFGHAVVRRLCELLPRGHIDELHAADLQAQGDPSEKADPERTYVESRRIRLVFDLLAATAGHRRSVVIHAKNPLSGKSFLLNRALVSHMTWDVPPMVELCPGPKIEPRDAPLLGANVIWRAGIGSVPIQPFAQARMTPADLIAKRKPASAQAAFDLGLISSLLDGLRRPMWTAHAAQQMRAGLGNPGWSPPQVGTLLRVSGRPTPAANRLLGTLAATRSELKQLGLDDGTCFTNQDGMRWVCIDVLARIGSCTHTELVEPVTKMMALRRIAEARRAGIPVPRAMLSRDDHQRLWFAIPEDPPAAKPTRSAVCALLTPDAVVEWARELSSRFGEPRGGPRGEARRLQGLNVQAGVLRGLSDLAGADVPTQMLLASMHERRGEWNWARGAYLRAARMPGGRRLGASGSPRVANVLMNESFRRVLLRLASAAARMRPGNQTLVDHAVWLMLSAAAADLVTLSDSPGLTLELRTTPAFLVREWAPRVRGVLAWPGTRRPGMRAVDLDRASLPEWARPLALAGMEVPPPSRMRRQRGERVDIPSDSVERIQELANAAVELSHAETPADALLTLPELGVWPAGSTQERFRELAGTQ
jgi:hypothetical protein